ncbi:Nnf1-domain-containing protein [Cryomyces antarcticus]
MPSLDNPTAAAAFAAEPQQPPSRSPSPPTSPPLPQAPGPRATALQKVFADALSHSLKTCSYSNFAACFPTAARYVPEALEGLWRDFVERLGGVCRTEFEAILADRSVIPSLNALDRLVADANKRKERASAAAGKEGIEDPIPPHTLPPSRLLHAHLFAPSHQLSDKDSASLPQYQSTLHARLSTTQAQNATLVTSITQQRQQIEQLIQGLESVVKDLDGSVEVLCGEQFGEEVTVG